MAQEIWWYLGGFTILQITVWIVFVRLVLRAAKNNQGGETERQRDREVKLFKLYQEVEDMMDSFEEYVNEVREELEKERADVMELSRKAAEVYLRTLDRPSVPPVETPKIIRPAPPAQDAEKKPESRLTAKDRDALRRFATKAQKVRYLMSCGFALEEVAKELNIGKGEVKLIAGLQK